ncbi:hypothetical protein A6E15_10050 [Natrinema saccharevitans]|uniref:Uncharacterized protein n=1 Tax=Natrinema saccharevitans TaxID=301967 RepID=A0A1S8AWR5_9EURY|nr:hypothetical protein [Natrinema saccharevitans]OLZ41308.1 hypothetical protein A6E15_10050 [Natrinema saccharevitans]
MSSPIQYPRINPVTISRIPLQNRTETEADLIKTFVPVAVDDVRGSLESNLETKERATELEAKIEKIGALIDEIVYELYGLTDEEIEIVEEAVGE